MKARHGKSAFFVVMMTLLLCGVLAIGATYAYDAYEKYTFVETNTEIEHKKVKFDLLLKQSDGNYLSMLGENGAKAFTNSMVWEPGKTEIVYLRVKNDETTNAIDCRVALEVPNSTFGNALEYAVINGDSLSPEIDSWSKFYNNAGMKGTLKETGTIENEKWYSFWNKTNVENVLMGSTTIPVNGCQDLILAIHMREDADNSVKNATMSLEFTAAASHVVESTTGNQVS